ncbi:MAG: FMN-dependent NADH-azoreductase [Pikeienuella sp.]
MSASALSILKIDSSGRKTGSASRQMTARLSDRLVAANTGATIVARDVSSGLPTVDEIWIGANFTPADARSEEQANMLSQSDELVAELRAADVLVIGLPIYNFGVPASLKAWIDLICRAGETFQYGENGPEGLLTGKRAIVTVASGGVPLGSPVDHASTYLKTVLGFVGITDVTFVGATGLAMDAEAPLRAAESEIDAIALKAAA